MVDNKARRGDGDRNGKEPSRLQERGIEPARYVPPPPPPPPVPNSGIGRDSKG